MLVHTITVGPFFENCFLVGDEKTKEAWIIDPGAEGGRIRAEIERLGLKPSKILLTHAHGDHIGAVDELRKLYGIPVFIHEKDHPLLIDAEENLSAAFGMPIRAGKADGFLAEGDKLELGDLQFKVFETPGHTPGGITIYGEKTAFTGDALFAGSIGRYDFPHSDGGGVDAIAQTVARIAGRYGGLFRPRAGDDHRAGAGNQSIFAGIGLANSHHKNLYNPGRNGYIRKFIWRV